MWPEMCQVSDVNSLIVHGLDIPYENAVTLIKSFLKIVPMKRLQVDKKTIYDPTFKHLKQKEKQC